MPGRCDQDPISGLIVDEAGRYGTAGYDIGGLPYGAPGFDEALRGANSEVARILGNRSIGFVEDMFDAAGVLTGRIASGGGVPRYAEARLFALKIRGMRHDVERLVSRQALRDVAQGLSASGLAATGSAFAFSPILVGRDGLDEPSPGKARRVTHGLAHRAVPGFPAPPEHHLGRLLRTDAASRRLSNDRTIETWALIGVRVLRVRVGLAAPRDWFTHLGGDVRGFSSVAHAYWTATVERRFAALGLKPLPPMPWALACTEVTIDGAADLFAAEADALGVWDDLSGGTLHHTRDGAESLVALAMPDGRVLGPARGAPLLLEGGLELLAMDLGIEGPAVPHADPGTFADLVRRGGRPDAGDALEPSSVSRRAYAHSSGSHH